MVIGKKYMYKYFRRLLKDNIESINESIKDLEEDRSSLSEMLKTNFSVLSKYGAEFYSIYNVKVEDIDSNYRRINVHNGITIPNNKKQIIYKLKLMNIDNDVHTLELIKSITVEYFNIKDKILKTDNDIYKLKSKLEFNTKYKDLDIKEFYYIIGKINGYFEEEILNGKRVYLGNGLGYIYIRYFKGNIKPKVDHKESKLKKQRIIEQGGIPYNRKDHEKAIREGREYDGIEWLVYHTTPIPYISWRGFIVLNSKGSVMLTTVPNALSYEFRPARHNHSGYKESEILEHVKNGVDINTFNIGMRTKLPILLKANETQHLKYERI